MDLISLLFLILIILSIAYLLTHRIKIPEGKGHSRSQLERLRFYSLTREMGLKHWEAQEIFKNFKSVESLIEYNNQLDFSLSKYRKKDLVKQKSLPNFKK